MTPIQRAAHLVSGYDLERLYGMIEGKQTISTRKVERELDRLKDRLQLHGIAHRDLFDELRKK